MDSLRADLKTWLHSEAPAGAFDWAIEFAEIFAPRPALGALDGGLNLGDTLAATEAGGFDIIVANPPYVRQELIKPHKPMLRRNFATVHDERTDLYIYFYARAQELLRSGGIAAFISSNKWLRAGYGEKLRQVLLDKQAFHLVADFGELPVFQTAATFPAVFVWEKTPRSDTATEWSVVKDLDACYAEGVREHVARFAEKVPASRFGVGGARLASTNAADRRARMDASGPKLGIFTSGRMLYGIKTGLNDAFVINALNRAKLIARDPRSAEVIKTFVSGDDVRKYEVHYRDTFLLCMSHGTRISNYPAIREHLLPFKEKLEARATKQEWWELQQPSIAYVSAWEGSKIIYPEIAKEPRFTMDKSGYYANKTVFTIPSDDSYLLAVLNSATAWSYLADICAVLVDENAGGRLTLQTIYLEKLPILNAPAASRAIVAESTRKVQQLHSERRARVERFLHECGLDPADSTSRNPLEMPWLLTVSEFARRRPRFASAIHAAARDETAAITEQIHAIEGDINARVDALYGF